MKIIKESLNETLNDSQKVSMYRTVYNYVNDTIDDALDNIAIAIASDVADYDPNWCSDGQSKVDKLREQAQDSFVIAVTKVLLDHIDVE